MSSIRSIILIISLFAVAAFAGSVIKPTERVTEPDRPEQFLKVQQEIYRHLSGLKAVQDSNHVQYGCDTTSAGAAATVYLNDKYNSTYFSVLLTQKGASFLGSMCALVLSDSSFSVTSVVGSEPFYWMTIGVKQ